MMSGTDGAETTMRNGLPFSRSWLRVAQMSAVRVFPAPVAIAITPVSGAFASSQAVTASPW